MQEDIRVKESIYQWVERAFSEVEDLAADLERTAPEAAAAYGHKLTSIREGLVRIGLLAGYITPHYITNTHTETDDRNFGCCPVCGSEGEQLDVGADHFGWCEAHMTAWHIGNNLFDRWRHQTPEQRQHAEEILAKCRRDELQPSDCVLVDYAREAERAVELASADMDGPTIEQKREAWRDALHRLAGFEDELADLHGLKTQPGECDFAETERLIEENVGRYRRALWMLDGEIFGQPASMESDQ
ncbi:MAG: hypothetical protein AMXMBFR13_22400 [Phycisphaerae bacterium]